VRFRNLLIADLDGERLVLLSSHIVSDVKATATHIALINLNLHGFIGNLVSVTTGNSESANILPS